MIKLSRKVKARRPNATDLLDPDTVLHVCPMCMTFGMCMPAAAETPPSQKKKEKTKPPVAKPPAAHAVEYATELAALNKKYYGVVPNWAIVALNQKYYEVMYFPDLGKATDGCAKPSLGEKSSHSMYGKFIQKIHKIQKMFNSSVVASFNVPPVYAMGMQSSGKSSTLERVLGVELFPVGGGMVTTMPVKLILRNDPKGDPTKVDVKYEAPSRLPGSSRLDENHPAATENMDLKLVSIKEAHKAVVGLMKKTMHKVKGKKTKVEKHVTHYPVEITLRSPCVPTLDIIDLPGVRVPFNENKYLESTAKQPVLSAAAETEAVTRHYMGEAKKDGAIILMVKDAGPRDLTDNDHATKMIHEEGLAGSAIGVFTKCNKHDKPEVRKDKNPYGGLMGAIKYELDDTELPDLTRGGYIGTISRDSTDPKRSHLDVSREQEYEASWFQEQTPLLERRHWGIGSLIDKIEEMSHLPIQYKWGPQAIQNICEHLNSNQAKLDTLGSEQLTLASLLNAVKSNLKVALRVPAFESVVTSHMTNIFSDATLADCKTQEQSAAANSLFGVGPGMIACLLSKAKGWAGDVYQKLTDEVISKVNGVFESDALPHKLVRFVNLRRAVSGAVATLIGEVKEVQVRGIAKTLKDLVRDLAGRLCKGADVHECKTMLDPFDPSASTTGILTQAKEVAVISILQQYFSGAGRASLQGHGVLAALSRMSHTMPPSENPSKRAYTAWMEQGESHLLAEDKVTAKKRQELAESFDECLSSINDVGKILEDDIGTYKSARSKSRGKQFCKTEVAGWVKRQEDVFKQKMAEHNTEDLRLE